MCPSFTYRATFWNQHRPGVGRRQRKRELTADHLAATAFALFEAHGFDLVTMEQIAERADVAKGTLYNYFPVKEALLAHQFRLELAGGMAQMKDALTREPGLRARMTALLQASAQWNRFRRPYIASYLRYRMAEIGAAPAPAADRQRSGVHFHPGNLLPHHTPANAWRGACRPCAARARLVIRVHAYGCSGGLGSVRPEDDDLEARLLLALDVLLDGIATSAPASKPATSR